MPLLRIARLALVGLVAGVWAPAQVVWSGRVVDQNEAPVRLARVTIHRDSLPPIASDTGPTGSFQVTLPAPGAYLVDVHRPGYYALEDRPVDIPPGGAETTLVLNEQKEVFQSVEVGAAPPAIDPAETSDQQRLSGTVINDIPYPASQSLRNSMRLVPGVIQDPSGGLHFHGGAEYQTQYTLDGFDVTDPITGRYTTLLAVEGVRSLDLSAARETAPNGRNSAGTLAIHVDDGGDHFHYTATNFIPGVDSRNGLMIGDWTPRAGFSGPIVKGRAWFSDSFNGEYNSGYVAGLPGGQNTNASWIAGNLFHAQVNLTPANILYADLLSNFDNQAHYGLGVLDPDPTTTSLTDHEWLAAVKDSHTWYGGALLEAGFAWQSVYHHRTPEGTQPYLVTPEGRSGNYFEEYHQHGRRDQFFVNFFPRARRWHGRHQLQAGGDVERLDYSAEYQRTAFEVVGLSGLPIFRTTFRGSGDFARPNVVLSAYLNDHWQPFERLAVDAGVRLDWDELVRQAAVSPRLAASWAPFGGARTKLTAGYSILRDASNLELFARPLDQQGVTTPYDASGQPQAPLVTTFFPGHNLKFPRFTQWSSGAERDFGHGVSGHFEWMRKRGSSGFVYTAESAAPVDVQPLALGYGFGGNYTLTNQRLDAYDEYAVTFRQSFGDQYGWMASYTRSRAVSNAVLDVSVDQPLQVQNNLGAMPWDAPNRLLGWGYFPVHGKNWAAAVLVDYRTGFPFAVTSDAGIVQGPVDGHRYPSNFDLNLHIERRFTFRGYRLALRLGCNNVTDHRNPTAVNSVIGAPNYLQFYGDEGRHFVVRIRMFGRAPK